MRALLACVAASCAALGCTTFAVAPEDAAPAASAPYSEAARPTTGTSLTIRRDSGLFGAACTHTVRVDGKFAANLRPGEQIVVTPPVGERTIEASISGLICNPQSTGAVVRIEEGRPRVFRTGMSGMFEIVLQPAPDDRRPPPK